MSYSSRWREYMEMGLSEAEAASLVQREREASERGEPAPDVPAKLLELAGQQTLFAPECWDHHDDREAA